MITVWVLVFNLAYGSESYTRINSPYTTEAICKREGQKVIDNINIGSTVTNWECKPILTEKK
jgi:hypothetical protein